MRAETKVDQSLKHAGINENSRKTTPQPLSLPPDRPQILHRNPKAVGQLAGHQNQRLARLGRLVPGDFKNVRDRFALADSRHDHENLVAGLEEEERIKKSQGGGNGIGF